MYSLSELHFQLQVIREKLTETSAHVNRAVELLEEAERTQVAAHEQAESWVPPQLAGAVERLRADADRLSAANELVDAYRARL